MKVAVHGLGIKAERDHACLYQHPQLGCEEKGISEWNEVEGFFPHPIAAQDQLAPACVPKRKCIHASQAVDKSRSVLLVRMDDRFTITAGREYVSASFKLTAQFDVIVDLAVGDEREASVLVVEGLPSGLQVDDAQPAHRQGNVRVRVGSLTVRTAVCHQSGDTRDLIKLTG